MSNHVRSLGGARIDNAVAQYQGDVRHE